MKAERPAYDMERAFGIVSEQVLSNDDLRSAIEMVISYEQDMADLAAKDQFNIEDRADVAARKEAKAVGMDEGFDASSLALINSEFIGERIALFRNQLEETHSES